MVKEDEKVDGDGDDMLVQISSRWGKPIPGFGCIPESRVSMTQQHYQKHLKNKSLSKNVIVCPELFQSFRILFRISD